MRWLLLLSLAGCWKPRETGPTSMVGHLEDATGAPLVGLSVETVEARWVTDETGRFAVNYKEPSRWIAFESDGVRYQRDYLPSDDKTDVRVRVPETMPVSLKCEMDETCKATLTWDLGEGYEARVRPTCDRDELTEIRAVPKRPPDSAVCTVSATSPDLPARIDLVPGSAGVWRLTPPPVPLTVHLSTESLELPTSCEVLFDGIPGRPAGEGRYQMDVFGRVQVSASCDGIPAVPIMIDVRQPYEYEMDWTPEGPFLDIQDEVPWADTARLAALEGTIYGWVIDIPISPDGRFRLPPLAQGTYAVGFGMSAERVLHTRPAAQLPPGSVHIRELPSELRQSDAPEAIGILRVDQALLGGDIPLTWYGRE